MPSTPNADGPEERALFTCRWQREGRQAASVWVSGELDLATAAQLEQALCEALDQARLVLLDLHALSFMDSTGLHVLLHATARARQQGARLVLAGATAPVETLLDVTGVRAHLDVLAPEPSQADRSRPEPTDESQPTPFDNPVNSRVVTGRVMAVSAAQLWMQAADGAIHRPWAPPTAGLPVPAGTQVELYLDAAGALNGWSDPESGLAINQRCLDSDQWPATYRDLACQGACGVVWQAPAAARLTERAERCLTCAGPLVAR